MHLTRGATKSNHGVGNLEPRVPDVGCASASTTAMAASCSDIAVTANRASPEADPCGRTTGFVGHRPARRTHQLRIRSASPQPLTQRSSAAITATKRSAMNMRSWDMLCSTCRREHPVSLPTAPKGFSCRFEGYGARRDDHKTYLGRKAQPAGYQNPSNKQSRPIFLLLTRRRPN